MVSGVDTHLYRAMRKYGWDKFHFEVIDSTDSQEKLNELEEHYIQIFDTIRSGYNMAKGGSINVMYSDVVADKHDKKMRSPEVRKKISESMKQSYRERGGPSDSHRLHLSQSRKALYNSEKGEEVKAKFRQSFHFSEEHFRALNDSKNKSVYCIDESGTVVAEFKRVKDAAIWWREHGYKVKHYDQLCDRIKQSYKEDRYIHGLKWIYRV